MRRLIAAVIVLGCLSGVAHAATMDVSWMAHEGDGAMACNGAKCAAAPTPAMPVQDCIDHCLRSAQTAGIAGTAAGAMLIFAVVTSAAAAVRVITPLSAPKGAPPHLGPSLRTLALAGVVMRN